MTRGRSGRHAAPDDDDETQPVLFGGRIAGLLPAERHANKNPPSDDEPTDPTIPSPSPSPSDAVVAANAAAVEAVVTEDIAARRPSIATRVGVVGRRAIAAGLSGAVLAVAGVGWTTVGSLQADLTRTDALSGPAPQVAEAGDGATDILLVGSDSRTDAQGNPLPLSVLQQLRTEETVGLNTDTIILLRVPDDGSAAHAVSIPRDTYVPIPGFGEDKINAAYGRTKSEAADALEADGVTDDRQVERESTAAGQRALVGVVQELTGVEVDHYAEVNLYGFYLLTEAIGGVDVCLNQATTDPDSGADFAAGPQVVSGGDALAFVRQRKNLPRGDLDRIVRQQVFMAGAANRVLSAGTLADQGRLEALLGAMQRSVILDDDWDVLGFAQQMQGIAAGSVDFTTIPVLDIAARNERGQSIVTVDPVQVRVFVAGLVGATPPPAAVPAPRTVPPAPPAQPVDVAPVPADITVTVLNGTGIDGLAAEYADRFVDEGFDTGEVANTAARATTVVRVAPGREAVGELVADALGGDVPIGTDATLDPDRALVLLGDDYTDLDVSGFTADPLLRLNPGPVSFVGPAVAAQPLGPVLAAQPPPSPPISAGGIPCVN